jgi:hypothetical protein
MTNKEKNGMGYTLSAAAYPELFNGFRIVNEFQCKDEKKVILNHTEVKTHKDYLVFTSTDEYKAAVVYIPISSMPVDLANMLLTVLKDGKAIIPIYPLTTQHIIIRSDRLEDADFPDCSEFITNIKYFEKIKIEIPAKKEGETYKGTGEVTFTKARRTIENFIGGGVIERSLKTFQKMDVTVYRYKDEAFRNQFIITSITDTFRVLSIMTACEDESAVVLSPEEIREAEKAGAIQDGQIAPKMRKYTKRAA